MVAATFVLLNKLGTMLGYYSKPDKLIVVCPLASEERTKATVAAMDYNRVKCVRGQYIHGHIGSTAMRD